MGLFVGVIAPNKKRLKKMESMQGLVKEIFDKNKEYKDVLVFIIQSLDKEFYKEVQSSDNTIGLIRNKVDTVLNKNKVGV